MRTHGVASRFHAVADACAARLRLLRGGERREAARDARAALVVLEAESMRAEFQMIGITIALVTLRDAGDPGAGDALAAQRARLAAIRAANEPEIGDAYLSLPWNRAALTD
jgi:hypothetical protein